MCPVVTQMSYSDMKENIDGMVSLEQARVVAHAGATLSGRGMEMYRLAASLQPCGGRQAGSV